MGPLYAESIKYEELRYWGEGEEEGKRKWEKEKVHTPEEAARRLSRARGAEPFAVC